MSQHFQEHLKLILLILFTSYFWYFVIVYNLFIICVCVCVCIAYIKYIHKFGVSKIFFKEIYMFIQQGCIELIKSDSKDIYKVTKDLYFK